MYINFQSLTFKNILSYGAELQHLIFKPGLNLIVGKNGSGKTAIIEALTYNLYGKPFRKIKINELVNRKNRKKLYTECIFNIGDINYKIVRTLQPYSLKLFKNNEEVEQLSSKHLIQNEIDKIIGIDYNMFRQIISLSMNYNKPFLTLYIFDKRHIIESIFNIKVFSDMLKILKKEMSVIDVQIEVNSKTLSIMENNIKSLRKRIRELNNTCKNFEQNKKNDIDKITMSIHAKEQEINNLTNVIHQLQHQLFDINLSNINKQHVYIKKQIDVDSFRLNQIKENLNILENNTICPTCKSDINTSDIHNTCVNLKQELYTLQNTIKNNIASLKLITHQIKTLNNYKDQQQQFNQQILSYTNKIDWLKSQLEYDHNNLSDVTNRHLNFNSTSLDMDKELQEKIEEYKTIYNQHENNLELSQINNIVSSILSDSGIKSHFYKKLIPLLNLKINQYLSSFEIPVRITFDELLEETISTVDGKSSNISYFTHSEGERKRIDLAILLSFIDMAKIILNWESNLLIIDELLDSALDDDGLDSVVSCLKNVSYNNKLSCMYIISHRSIESYHFSDQLLITKNAGFSSINTRIEGDEYNA